MNIFTTSPDPAECAAALDDKRVVKMCLETAKMLSTRVGGPYRPTHVHHPCIKWAHNQNHWMWLWDHFQALSAEYRYRFGRDHKSSVLCWPVFQRCADVLQYRIEVFNWPNCARNTALGLDFTHMADVHAAYRAYLNARWQRDKRPPKWTNCNPPHWKDT